MEPSQATDLAGTAAPAATELPRVSVVFLAYNRREPLLVSLHKMIEESGYPADRLEVIVVDNASTDGTAEAVQAAYRDLRVIRNPENIGAPGWNRGFAQATGDYVLILDDDAYLPAGALRQAVAAAQAEAAGLVSFAVVSSFDDARTLNEDWRTGLLSFWGCAALVSAPAMRAVRGYDPDMFIWANEVDFTMRVLDAGFRHLYLPDVRAVHMKERFVQFEPRRYLVNARHHAYIAGKSMRPLDAVVCVSNIVQRAVIDGIVEDRVALRGMREAAAGFRDGLRRRHPVRPAVSAAYRRNFHPYASPWRFMRTPADRVRSRLGARGASADERRAHRLESYFDDRSAYYPSGEATLTL